MKRIFILEALAEFEANKETNFKLAGWVDASTLKPARIPPHILNTLL